MENKIRAVLLTTAGVLTAMLFWSWKHRPPEAVLVRTAAAETQDIYNSVTIFGTVESAESTAVCPAKNGVVSAAYAATGDTVQKGDILCTLTDIIIFIRQTSVFSTLTHLIRSKSKKINQLAFITDPIFSSTL